jgi:multiple sugar transport system substrate-binding protein
MFSRPIRVLILIALVVAAFAPGAMLANAQGVKELKIIWAQWSPADYLQQIGKEYEEKTGIKVTVIQEPWGSYLTRVSAEWAAKGDAFDMLVGDSQWLGQAATQGHYVDLTEFMKSNGIEKTVTPATLQYYGEYPAGSGKYWAYPTEGDANGFAYRKDLFEDAKEKEAFKAKYNRDLAVPKTWAEFMDIAQFFTRKDKGLYGAAIYTQKDYDGLTMGVQNVFFSYGADWSDKDFKVQGIVNSENAVKAIEFYKALYDCCSPPGMSNAFFQETNDAYTSGQVAMTMNYFAFFPALANKATNKFAETTGYFSMPTGPDGKTRFAALGGQGISVSSYVSKERQQASLDFIKWFAQEDVQARWADLGGYTCNINVLKSEKFLKVAPFNAAFAETMTFVKDFFNIPVYGELLTVVQAELSNYIIGGKGTAKEALDKVATEWDKILKEGGFQK